jgi:SWI/SNF-related matrix-associated actin-dependent regulator of chromatin subfamily A3
MANRVFIVEPQWNPSVENQAVARALRLGQKQTVLVTRYVVEQTVEQVRWHDLDCSSSLT